MTQIVEEPMGRRQKGVAMWFILPSRHPLFPLYLSPQPLFYPSSVETWSRISWRKKQVNGHLNTSKVYLSYTP